jgi:hypothetical protein
MINLTKEYKVGNVTTTNKTIPAAILVMTATTNALCQMLLVPLDWQWNASLNELDRVTRRVSYKK